MRCDQNDNLQMILDLIESCVLLSNHSNFAFLFCELLCMYTCTLWLGHFKPFSIIFGSPDFDIPRMKVVLIEEESLEYYIHPLQKKPD